MLQQSLLQEGGLLVQLLLLPLVSLSSLFTLNFIIFTLVSTALFQIRLSPIGECLDWIVSE